MTNVNTSITIWTEYKNGSMLKNDSKYWGIKRKCKGLTTLRPERTSGNSLPTSRCLVAVSITCTLRRMPSLCPSSFLQAKAGSSSSCTCISPSLILTTSPRFFHKHLLWLCLIKLSFYLLELFISPWNVKCFWVQGLNYLPHLYLSSIWHKSWRKVGI